MPSFRILCAKLTGSPGPSGWAQIHDFKPEDSQKLKLRGRLFAVVATSKMEEGIDSVVAGRELLARLHEEYFGNSTSTAFNAIKEAAQKVIKEFKKSWGDVQIAAAVFLDNTVYSAVGGGAQVALFREGALVKILVSTKDEVVSASGYPKEKDVLLLGTELFFSTLSEGIIKEALKSGEVDAAAESLAPVIHTRKDSGSLGAVLIGFMEKGAVFTKPKEKKKDKTSKKETPFEFVGNFNKKLASFLQKIIDILPERRIYVKGEEVEAKAKSGRRVAIVVGGILIALLAVSIFFGIKQKKTRQTRFQYEARLIQAKHEFEEAQSLFSLNPIRSRELLISAQNTAEELFSEGVSDPELDELKVAINEKKGLILGEYTHGANLFVDLALLSSGFSGEDLALVEKRILVLDRDGRKIVSVAIDTKKAEVVAGPEQVGDAEYISGFTEKVYTITPSAIFEINKSVKRVIEGDWEGEVLLYTYAGNLYVLEKGNSIIWRYPVVEGGFGTKQKWFGPGVEPDLSNVISWTIDGSIWLMTPSGRVLKFTRGKPDAFNISGVNPPINSALAIYTNEELGFVYILDNANKRVVVLDKEGIYVAQYISEKTGEASDLVVTEEGGKIILLAGSKLYSIELKHLEE